MEASTPDGENATSTVPDLRTLATRALLSRSAETPQHPSEDPAAPPAPAEGSAEPSEGARYPTEPGDGMEGPAAPQEDAVELPEPEEGGESAGGPRPEQTTTTDALDRTAARERARQRRLGIETALAMDFSMVCGKRRGGQIYRSADGHYYTRKASGRKGRVWYAKCHRLGPAAGQEPCYGTAIIRDDKLIPRQAHNHPPREDMAELLRVRHDLIDAVENNKSDRSVREIFDEIVSSSPLGEQIPWQSIRCTLERRRVAAGGHVERRLQRPLVPEESFSTPHVTKAMVNSAVAAALAGLHAGADNPGEVTDASVSEVVAEAIANINKMKGQRGLDYETIQGVRAGSELYVSSDHHAYSRRFSRGAKTYLSCRREHGGECAGTAMLVNGRLVPRQAHSHPPSAEWVQEMLSRARVRRASLEQPHRSISDLLEEEMASSPVQLSRSLRQTLLRDRKLHGVAPVVKVTPKKERLKLKAARKPRKSRKDKGTRRMIESRKQKEAPKRKGARKQKKAMKQPAPLALEPANSEDTLAVGGNETVETSEVDWATVAQGGVGDPSTLDWCGELVQHQPAADAVVTEDAFPNAYSAVTVTEANGSTVLYVHWSQEE